MSCVCTPYCPPPQGDTTIGSEVSSVSLVTQSVTDRSQYIVIARLSGDISLLASGGIVLSIDPNNDNTIIIYNNPSSGGGSSSGGSTSASGANASGAWDPTLYVPGTINAATKTLLSYTPVRYCTLPVGLVGTFAKCDVSPGSSYVVTLNKNGSSIGTITYSAGSLLGTKSFANAVSFDPAGNSGQGDIFSVVSPAGIDGSFAGLSISFKGLRIPDSTTGGSGGGGGGGGTGNRIVGELPGGALDNVNTTFTLANGPVVGTLALYQNGSRLKSPTDYTISGLTITFAVAPLSTDDLQADYAL